MQRRFVLVILTVVVAAIAAAAQSGGGFGPFGKKTESASVLGQASAAWGQIKAAPGFNALKELVGEWEGISPTGTVTHVSYKLTSGGTALVETLTPAGEPEMTTVYSADGDQVAVTHFCSANNQPRMRTTSMDKSGKEYVFSYVGGTNIPKPPSGHMSGLTLTIEDRNHISQKWTWTAGQKQMSDTFRYTRKS